MNYPIRTDIPPPKREQRAKVNYAAMPLKTMPINGSFFVKESECAGRSIHAVASTIRTKAKRMGVQIRTEVKRPADAPHGLMVWKVK